MIILVAGKSGRANAVPLRGGGRGVSYPGPRGKRGAPRSLVVRQFFNSDCQCKSFSCFMLTRFSRTIAKKNENIILLNGFWR